VKYVVITGGVLSGLGKGIVASSLARLLQGRGYKVCPIKFDGYLNVDAGTMNPYRHGEVFVLDDGTECDMDLGNYERFTGLRMKNENNITGGKLFKLVLEKERRGDYLGVDVQFIPHLTGEIKEWVKKTGESFGADITIIEVGGTVGDIENSYFIEAMRQLNHELARDDVVFVHVTLVPKLKVVGEQKSKPTQQSVKELLSMGVQPDFILCRCEEPLEQGAKEKISMFSNVPMGNVISDHDSSSVYAVPFVLEKDSFSENILKSLSLPVKTLDMKEWKKNVDALSNSKQEVNIVIAGKYTRLKDAYVSIMEALSHAGVHYKTKVNLNFLETTDLNEKQVKEILKKADGLIVPIGWGSRGAEGKIKCIEYARKNNIPFLGLCYGFQLAVVEFARNVCGIKKANSVEVDPKTPDQVICILPEKENVKNLGGTLRLGSYPANLTQGSLAQKLYGKEIIEERHRHRYEVNPEYIKQLESKGLVFSGVSPDRELMEVLELPTHPFFIATQAHPEYKSTFESPSPVFLGFVKAATKHNN